MPPPGALTRRTRILLSIGIVVLLGFSVHRLYFAEPPGPYVALSGNTMGTTWTVKLAGNDLGPEAIREAGRVVGEALDDVVAQMSTWEETSELSNFNALASRRPFAVSQPVIDVLSVARRVSLLSGGAFDVTVGPLVEAWGFGSAAPLEKELSEGRIRGLLRRVGVSVVEIDSDKNTLRKSHPLAKVDVSAIAKGYGVDRVAEALESLGHLDYLVEVGGELKASGRKRDGEQWRVAIERPSEEIRLLHRVIILDDQAMATSGDYRNFYEIDGKRIFHTLDPRTGRPVDHALASVSVVHDRATWADAWATALNVLGPHDGYALALDQGLAAHFIMRSDGEGFGEWSTPGFEALLAPAGGPGDGAGNDEAPKSE
ncbi:MAG: FAD:protein FMN transferase [Myxococcota bacterium]|nr:FAD:protein FMN transferase [Myxococcota bacterium]